MTPRPGLDEQGFIAREGSPARVPPVFRSVVGAARDRITDLFGERLHSAYLYGSIPRGTARVGRSDLDLLLALREEPTEADRAAARALDDGLDAEFEQIDGAGTLLVSRAQVLSELERHDLGWFVACLCTPLLGEDLAGHLPRYRPDSLLARETNGDLDLCLPRWRRLIAEATAPGAPAGAVRVRVRGISRRLVRTGFTLVMPRWQGWTSDLYEMAGAFAAYYPEWGPRMAEAAALGLRPTDDPAVLRAFLRPHVEELGSWMAGEYARVHGVKAPRPE
ncbi:nucleotidyltransferase domain-containing protein [Streptomyces sp. GQFP]|uniref:nucleotidyltransferase domain-containing protein n=1 Tax=Streptomyces sp. GQFP TaxID=2907545 RepID=UPI001F3E9F8F|nr:nucleotidyltransferase domain-containing protein [Streptomyces sp. GQFP]UIX32111.1 nucleotidyltransferase domain-containing protein [Streptomyces sp. GQFP]